MAYTKTTWVTGDTITADGLNNLENMTNSISVGNNKTLAELDEINVGYDVYTYHSSAVTYEWDGTTTGHDSVSITIGAGTDDEATFTLYKIAENIAGIENNSISNIGIAEIYSISDAELEQKMSTILDTTTYTNAWVALVDGIPAAVYAKNGDATVENATVPHGLWVLWHEDYDIYIHSVTINPKTTTWDGTTTGLESITYNDTTYYQIATTLTGIDVATAEESDFIIVSSDNDNYFCYVYGLDAISDDIAVISCRWNDYDTTRYDTIILCQKATTSGDTTITPGIWVSHNNTAHYVATLAYGFNDIKTPITIDKDYLITNGTYISDGPDYNTEGQIGSIVIDDEDNIYMCMGYNSNWDEYDWQQIESTDNKVTSISSSSTDTEYPSAKAVYTAIGNVLPTTSTAGTIAVYNGSSWQAQSGYGYGSGLSLTWDGVNTNASVGNCWKVSTNYYYSSDVLGATVVTYSYQQLTSTPITSSNFHQEYGGWYIDATMAGATVTGVIVASTGALQFQGATWPQGLYFKKSNGNTYVQSIVGPISPISTSLLPSVSQTQAGIMSIADKQKLDAIQESADAVSVSSTGTATDEVQYITINGVEKKLAGGGAEYTAGTGITITDNTIAAADTLATKAYVTGLFSLNGTELTITTV